MWEQFLNGIRNMGIFLLCAQTLVQLRPKGSYEKYLKLLVNAMLLVQLLNPIARILGIGEQGSFQERISRYGALLEESSGATGDLETDVEGILVRLLEEELSRQQSEGAYAETGEAAVAAEGAAAGEEQDRPEDSEADLRISVEVEQIVIEGEVTE